MKTVKPDHEELRELIPEYLNGQLTDTLRSRVDAAAREDEAFAAEVEVFRGIRQAVRSDKATTIGEELGWQRLQRDMRRTSVATPARSGRELTRWRAAAAVLAFIALAQTIVLTGPRDDGQYLAAGDPMAQSQFILRIGFQPTASAGQIGALLQEIDGEFVGGPGSLGLYEVAFADEQALRDAQTVLDQRPQIVDTATRN